MEPAASTRRHPPLLVCGHIRLELRVSSSAKLIRARPRDAPEENNAFLIGNSAFRIDYRSIGHLAQQPQQARSSLGPTHPAERTSRLTRDSAISVIEQLAQQRNGRGRGASAAAAAGADLRRMVPQQ